MSGSHLPTFPSLRDDSGFSEFPTGDLEDIAQDVVFTGQEDELDETADVFPDEETKLPPKRSRASKPDHIKHRRTRTGCYTCRNRRVKCDEQRPICERCAKGKRECTYPEARPNPKTPTDSQKFLRHNALDESRSPSTEEANTEITGFASPPQSSRPKLHSYRSDTSDSRRGRKSSHSSGSAQSRALTQNLRVDQMGSPSTDMSSGPSSAPLDDSRKLSLTSAYGSEETPPSWLHLPEDLQYYLEYHQTSLNSNHYLLKHDAERFLHGILIDHALRYDPLLYAVVGFAAYHMTVRRPGGMMEDFLGYYNKAVSSLRKSLAGNQAHNDAILLTILLLATFEEFLGDYVSVLSHQQAAFQMISTLYSPETIMQSELARKMFPWYVRFDLTSGLMAEREATLKHDYFIAEEQYYQRQLMMHPENIDLKIEAVLASHRVLCVDLASFFFKAGSSSRDIIRAESEQYKRRLDRWHDDLDHVFKDEQYKVMDFGGRQKDPMDIVDPYQPGGLWRGPLYSFNFMQIDWLAMSMMFRYKMAIILQEALPSDLSSTALEACRLLEAIEYWPDSPTGAVLRTQACLGIASLFLPKDERHVMWCRRKFAKIESLGHIYPSTFRTRMASLWGLPEIRNWWLPNEDSYPAVVRSIRSYMEDRLPLTHSRPQREDARNIKSIFAHLSIDDAADRSGIKASPSASTQGSDAASLFSARQDDYGSLDSEDNPETENALLNESRQRFNEMMQNQEGIEDWL